MARIRSRRGGHFRAPAAPRSEEADFARALTRMQETIETRFENNVLRRANKRVVEQFEDGAPRQEGNWAKVINRLSRHARAMIMRQFSNARIDRMVDDILNRADRRSAATFYRAAERRFGIDRTAMAKAEALTYQRNAQREVAKNWVRKLRDESLETFTNTSIQAMSEGRPLDEVVAQFRGVAEKRKNHAQYLARNQIQNYNSTMTKLRAESAGIRRARWITADDERVRPCHDRRDGKEFDLREGFYHSCDGKTLWPGSDHNCRCSYDLIVDPED